MWPGLPWREKTNNKHPGVPLSSEGVGRNAQGEYREMYKKRGVIRSLPHRPDIMGRAAWKSLGPSKADAPEDGAWGLKGRLVESRGID